MQNMSRYSKNSDMSKGGRYCCCIAKAEKQHLVARAGCADDEAAVAALPEQWIPKRGGPILAEYLEQQKRDHEKVFQDITEGAKVINKDIDSRVRALAEYLLDYIQQNQNEIECVLEQVGTSEESITASIRNEKLKKIHELHTKRVEDIARFKRESLSLERERADGIKNLLRDSFQRLIVIGRRPPKELLHEFDELMYEINQQLLSNSRAYTELEANLCAQLDESVIKARSILNQLCLGMPFGQRGRSALQGSRENRPSRRSNSASVERTRNSSQPSISYVLDNNNMNEFDECVTRLVDAYKSALLKVFMGFSGKFSDLHEGLGKCSYIEDGSCFNDTSDLQKIVERVLHRLSVSFHKKIPESRMLFELTRTNVMSMQKSLGSLGECLQNTYMLLKDAGHLWDAHIMRTAVAQKLTIAAVEDLLTSNDAVELASEIPINIAIEQLRFSAEKDKLQSQYDGVIVMLENIAQLYQKHSEAELERLRQFMNLLTPMSNTLLAEFNLFLEKYPTSPVKMTSSILYQSNISSPRTTQNLKNTPLPRSILQTELQELSLTNWKNGFLETFEANVSLVPEELNRQCQQWVEERSAVLHMRYSMKLAAHSIRLERMKAARDKRLAEICHHEMRLSSHLEAIKDLVDRLPSEPAQLLTFESPFLYPINQWLDRIEEDMTLLLDKQPVDPEVKRLKMSSYALRLLKHRTLFEESIEVVVEDVKRLMEYRIQEGRISNLRFISQLSLFGEGGRYAVAEAMKTSAILVKASDTLESCVCKCQEALNARRVQLLLLVDQKITPLQKNTGEASKTGAKGKLPKK